MRQQFTTVSAKKQLFCIPYVAIHRKKLLIQQKNYNFGEKKR